MRKTTPKPMAPRWLLEELHNRQQTLIKQHISELRNVEAKPSWVYSSNPSA